MLNKELLKMLVCPACQGDLDEKDRRLVCGVCGLKYPIKDGVPFLLVKDAEK